MNAPVQSILRATRQTSTTLKRLASLTLSLPLLTMASLPSALNAQASLSLVQPATTTVVSGQSNARQIAADAAGNLYIPNNNGGITKITPGGTQSVVASGLRPAGVAVDAGDNVYVVSTASNSLVKIAPNGAQTTLSSNFVTPDLVAVDGLGNVYVMDIGANQVDEISAGVQTTVINNLGNPSGLTADSSGDVYVSNGSTNQVLESDGPGNMRVFASVNSPGALAMDKNGDLFIATGANNVVELPAKGQQITVDSGPSLISLAVDQQNNLFMYDGNNVLKAPLTSANFAPTSVCPNNNCGETITLTYAATNSGSVGSVIALSEGSKLTSLDFGVAGYNCGSLTAGSTCTVNVKFSPRFAGLRTGAIQLLRPDGSLAAQTNLYGIAQGPQIAFDGAALKQVVSVANPNAVTVDGAGDVFFVTNNNVVWVPVNTTGQNVLYSGLSQGTAVALDSAGNVYAGDAGDDDVLKITPAGAVSTVATGVCPYGLAVDPFDNVYIADDCHNRVVEVLASTGTQLALGTGLNLPTAVALDSSGNLFIADTLNSRVVEISAKSGAQTTVADGFPDVEGVAVDAAGNLLLTSEQQVVELPATGATPIVLTPQVDQSGIALDSAGDVFFTEAAYSQVVELKRSQPPALTFPSTPVNQSSTLSFTLENIGNQQLTAVSPGLRSTSPYFQLLSGSGDCTTTFSQAPGTSCNVSISFEPAWTGTITGTFEAFDNSLNSPNALQVSALSGVGVQ